MAALRRKRDELREHLHQTLDPCPRSLVQVVALRRERGELREHLHQTPNP